MNTIIPIGSLSYAQRARRVLRARGIWARLVKDEASRDTDGCVYAVEVRERDNERALTELRAAGIPHRVRQ